MDAIAEKDRLAAALAEPRARIGLIIPSVNRMTEPQFNHYAPEGLGVHVARGRVAGQPRQDGRRTDRRDRPCRRHAGRRRARPHRLPLHPHLDEGRRRRRGAHHRPDPQDHRHRGAVDVEPGERRAARARPARSSWCSAPTCRTTPSSTISTAAGFTVVKDVALKCKTAGRLRGDHAAALARARAGERHAGGRRHLPELHQHDADRGGGRDRGGARQAGGQQQSGGAVGLPEAAQGKARRRCRRCRISGG